MFNVMGPSLADIAAVTGNNRNNDGGFGDGNGWWVLIILFALFGGWGNNGYGNQGGAGAQGALTRGDLCMDMNFNGLENAVGRIADNQAAIARQTDNAICNLGYNNAQLANGIQMQIGNEFRGLDNAICTLGYNMQGGFNQIMSQAAQCCCDQKAEAAQTRYDMATGFCNLGNLIQSSTRDIIDNQNNQYLRQVERENQDLRIAASNAMQTNEIISKLDPCPNPAYIVPNPNCCYGPVPYGYGYNNGCGCNQGCGCN